MMAIVDSHRDAIEGQKYKLDYSYQDYRPWNYQNKINSFLKWDYEKPLPFEKVNRTDIQLMIETIIWSCEEKLEEMVGV